jgi:hypothetical protein
MMMIESTNKEQFIITPSTGGANTSHKSSSLNSPSVKDLESYDLAELSNPQMTSIYAGEIFDYLRSAEVIRYTDFLLINPIFRISLSPNQTTWQESKRISTIK